MFIPWLRRLRHGPLRRLGPAWVAAGERYRRRTLRARRPRAVQMSIGGYGPFAVHPYFAFSDFEHWGGAHNAGFRSCVEQSRGAGCVIDVGAHIGLVTLPVSTVIKPDGVVVAFEPAEWNRRMLEFHVERNGATNVEIVDALVGAEPAEEVLFYEMAVPTGMNSVVARERDARYSPAARRQITLDAFCAERGLEPDVIKIDVEGAELGVLEGARSTLIDARPWIYLSVHPAAIASIGRSVDDLRRIIEELGYVCRTVDGRPVDEFRLSEYELEPVEGGR